MARLLIVHHTASPALHSLFEAVRSGASDPQIEGVDVVARPALGATAVDVLEADGYLLGTPANLGRMISQAAARRNITVIMRQGDLPHAMQRLHEEFFG